MKIFITDGSCDGFFTAVFDAYRLPDAAITSDNRIQLSFDCEVERVNADGAKSERVKRGLSKYDRSAVADILLVLRSGNGDKEQIAFEYVKTIFDKKTCVKKAFNIPSVEIFRETRDKVTLEAHRMKGFLRFTECADGMLYAPYSPDNDITDMLMPHFAARLKNQIFVIHDVKRKTAGIYNRQRWIIGRVGEAKIYISEQEKTFSELWKKYYDSVNIGERPHEKQMRGYMPARYWKFLPEKKDG